jgi:hypothetical protein
MVPVCTTLSLLGAVADLGGHDAAAFLGGRGRDADARLAIARHDGDSARTKTTTSQPWRTG